MPVVMMGGRDFEVDEEGFLKNPSEWEPGLAVHLARAQGIEELTEDHWKVINFLRRYYEEQGRAPSFRTVRSECGFELRQVYDLFPAGPALGAARAAGLPRPGGCL